ncbi:hypothetical protein [Synechococcus sp. RC10A2]|uniref:hypothetical protein n=1 Tax=Synechococcus sp. RC10A2 TaxID=2964529 RepID=UPI0039C71DB3
MRKRKTVGVPVQVYNLGSPAGAQMDFERDELWSRMDAEMGKKAVSLPVFLVNPNQMNMLYPREYRRALDPERIRPLLQEEVEREARERDREGELETRREPQEGEQDLFDRLKRYEEEEGWLKYSRVVAVGLYLRLGQHNQQFQDQVLQLGDPNVRTAEAENAFLNHQLPTIFLCCERIVNWASRLGISHHLVMDKVYYHELGHAIMDTLPDGAPNPYLESWGRIVEESLANAVAFRCFRGREALWVQRLIQDQPAEYRGYAAAGQLLVSLLDVKFLRDWFREWLHEYDLYWWHRIEYALARLERGAWHPEVARALTEVLRNLPMPLTQIRSHERIDSQNITEWRRFKRRIARAEPWIHQAWKDFAKHLLIEGVS